MTMPVRHLKLRRTRIAQFELHARLIGKPFVSNAVYIGKGTVVEQGAMIKGPAWIGDGCEIRNGCYIVIGV